MIPKPTQISGIGDEYNRLLADGSIGKAMKKLFKLDKHHLFTPFKMGFYCAVLLAKEYRDKTPRATCGNHH